MRIALVHGNDGSEVRLGKTCRSLAKLGHEVHFVGWDRRPAEAKNPNLPGIERHVMPLAVPFGQSTWPAQWRFTWHVVQTLRQIKPDVVCAVNEDNAVRLLPFRRLLFRRMVCDVFDSHRDRGSSRPLPIRWALAGMSELSRAGADTLIATDQARYNRFGRHRRKTVIIGNYPEDPGPELSRTELVGPTKIAVCGTLTETRGIRELLSAVEKTDDARIVAAGWPNDDFAANVFVTHPRVDFHGIVQSRQALELTAGCDAAFAFYAPICRNNILASPNKIYDAMSVGRPVIVNSEAEISRWVVDQSVGHSCPYDDVDRLTEIVRSLQAAREDMKSTAAKTRELFLADFTWQKMEERLAALYGRHAATCTQQNRGLQAA